MRPAASVADAPPPPWRTAGRLHGCGGRPAASVVDAPGTPLCGHLRFCVLWVPSKFFSREMLIVIIILLTTVVCTICISRRGQQHRQPSPHTTKESTMMYPQGQGPGTPHHTTSGPATWQPSRNYTCTKTNDQRHICEPSKCKLMSVWARETGRNGAASK